MARRRRKRLQPEIRRKKTSFFQSFEKWFLELLGGMVLLAVSIILLTNTLYYKSLFVETKGEIVSQHPINSYSKNYSGGRTTSNRQYYIYEVFYQVNGTEFYSKQYTNTSNSLKSGDTVTVKYCKNNPQELIDYHKISNSSVMGIISGILLIIIGLANSRIIHIP